MLKQIFHVYFEQIIVKASNLGSPSKGQRKGAEPVHQGETLPSVLLDRLNLGKHKCLSLENGILMGGQLGKQDGIAQIEKIEISRHIPPPPLP